MLCDCNRVLGPNLESWHLFQVSDHWWVRSTDVIALCRIAHISAVSCNSPKAALRRWLRSFCLFHHSSFKQGSDSFPWPPCCPPGVHEVSNEFTRLLNQVSELQFEVNDSVPWVSGTCCWPKGRKGERYFENAYICVNESIYLITYLFITACQWDVSIMRPRWRH